MEIEASESALIPAPNVLLPCASDEADRRLTQLQPNFPARLSEVQANLSRRREYLVFKRQMDFWLALGALLALLPILLLVFLLLRLSSRGPAIFRQTRVGLRQKPFVMYKFRTMRVGPEPVLSGLQRESAGRGVLVKGRKDPRVTALGRILRVTSLDELPQLINVLKGDMSLVGPRPLLPFMLAPYPEFSAIRSLVRPGITGLWQLRDRANNTNATAMMAHDLEYVQRLGLGLDLAILLRTPWAVASRQGAC